MYKDNTILNEVKECKITRFEKGKLYATIEGEA